jgi:topoisomerase-4 subunit A
LADIPVSAETSSSVENDLSETTETPDAVSSEKESAKPEVKAEKPKAQDKKEPESKPVDDIPFEITNPDDIQIDNNGQLGLFGESDPEDDK